MVCVTEGRGRPPGYREAMAAHLSVRRARFATDFATLPGRRVTQWADNREMVAFSAAFGVPVAIVEGRRTALRRAEHSTS